MRRPSFALLFAFFLAFLISADTAHAEKNSFRSCATQSARGISYRGLCRRNRRRAHADVHAGRRAHQVSESGEGEVVALPDPNHAGKAQRTVTVLSGLNEPHGLAVLRRQTGYRRRGITNFAATTGTRRICGRPIPKLITDPPKGGSPLNPQHPVSWWQDLCLDGIELQCMYREGPAASDAVMEFNPDGSGQKIFVKDVRNAVGLAVNPKTDTVWVTVSTGATIWGRPAAGDNLRSRQRRWRWRLAILLWRPRPRFEFHEA